MKRRGMRFWQWHRQFGRLLITVVYNDTFSMADGPVGFYSWGTEDEWDLPIIRGWSLRIGHLWLDVDLFGRTP